MLEEKHLENTEDSTPETNTSIVFKAEKEELVNDSVVDFFIKESKNRYQSIEFIDNYMAVLRDKNGSIIMAGVCEYPTSSTNSENHFRKQLALYLFDSDKEHVALAAYKCQESNSYFLIYDNINISTASLNPITTRTKGNFYKKLNGEILATDSKTGKEKSFNCRHYITLLTYDLLKKPIDTIMDQEELTEALKDTVKSRDLNELYDTLGMLHKESIIFFENAYEDMIFCEFAIDYPNNKELILKELEKAGLKEIADDFVTELAGFKRYLEEKNFDFSKKTKAMDLFYNYYKMGQGSYYRQQRITVNNLKREYDNKRQQGNKNQDEIKKLENQIKEAEASLNEIGMIQGVIRLIIIIRRELGNNYFLCYNVLTKLNKTHMANILHNNNRYTFFSYNDFNKTLHEVCEYTPRNISEKFSIYTKKHCLNFTIFRSENDSFTIQYYDPNYTLSYDVIEIMTLNDVLNCDISVFESLESHLSKCSSTCDLDTPSNIVVHYGKSTSFVNTEK